MALPHPSQTPADRMLRRLERERKQESDGIAAAWAFLWILFAFKIATVLIIMYVASGTGESIVMVAATTWYWLVIPVLALSGPLLIRWRMMKLRRRREQLRRSEWDVAAETEPTLVTLHVPPDDR